MVDPLIRLWCAALATARLPPTVDTATTVNVMSLPLAGRALLEQTQQIVKRHSRLRACMPMMTSVTRGPQISIVYLGLTSTTAATE